MSTDNSKEQPMEEKELYYKLEDNGDMSCVCQSMNEVTEIMESKN